jgi:hypothetical protein
MAASLGINDLPVFLTCVLLKPFLFLASYMVTLSYGLNGSDRAISRADIKK